MTFSHIVSAFFTNHLATERGLAANTIASYSDCMKLLINFACERFGIEPEKLGINQLSRELIIDFLDHLENTRHNVESTRNQRLAAIKTFFHFLARNIPELMHLNATIQAIREKNTDTKPPPSMTVNEVHAIQAAPSPNTLLGVRDRALMKLMYNSGARVQELADLTIPDVRSDKPATVKLTGKGRKTRVIPLWDETVEDIGHYVQMRQRAGIKSERLFVNVRGQPITRFGIGRMVTKYARQAAHTCPSLRDRIITPHVFRHTTALHLLEAENDIMIVKDWLGHADLRTTNRYMEVSIERKRAALAKMPPPGDTAPPEQPNWKQPELITFLSNLSRGVMLPRGG